MKVAFLCFNKAVFESSFLATATLLTRHSHKVKSFYKGDASSNHLIEHTNCDWGNWEISALEEYAPDRIIVFNGSFGVCHSVIKYLKTRYSIMYAELAWLPQRDHLYIGSWGAGGRSYIRHSIPIAADAGQAKQIVGGLQMTYAPTVKLDLPADYIFVPLQITTDTSILYDSPYFKNMPSLVGFVKRHFPDYPIVVKPHPLDKETFSMLKDVIIADKTTPVNDLSYRAKAIIGINSTALIEALIHHKPVATLGYNVASGKGVYVEPDVAFTNPRALLTWKPNHANVNNVLFYLWKNQFHRLKPTTAVVQLIEKGPRPEL